MTHALCAPLWHEAADAAHGGQSGFAKWRGAVQHAVMAACFEAAPPQIHTRTPILRPGSNAGPHLPALGAGGADRTHGQGFADAAHDARKLCLRSWRQTVSALDSGAITTPDGGRLSCATHPSFSPFWPRPRFRAAWKPKASPASCKPKAGVRLPGLPPVRSSLTRPTTAPLPGPQSAPLRAVRPATPVSARPATETAAARRVTARTEPVCRHRGFRPRWRFVSPAMTAQDITKGGRGISAPGGRD